MRLGMVSLCARGDETAEKMAAMKVDMRRETRGGPAAGALAGVLARPSRAIGALAGALARPSRATGALAALACVLASLVVVAPASADGWLTPTDISVAGQTASAPRVAIDPQGVATAVWARSNATNTIIQAAQRAANGVWQAPVDISATGKDASDPQIAIDGQGNAVAIWQRPNAANSIIVQAAVRPAGGAWQAPTDLSVTGRDAVAPRLAVDAQGTAIAVWQRLDTANVVIQAAVRPAGGAWQAPTNLSASGHDASAPAIAVNPQGAAVAVWQRSNGTNAIIQGAARPAGGTWQAPADLSAAGQDAVTPQVAVDPTGAAVAVWDRQAIVETATRTAAGAWQPPLDLSTGCKIPTTPQVAASAQGAAVAIWSCLVGSSPSVQSSFRASGGSWEAPTTLAAGGSAVAPEAAFDPLGDVLAIWSAAVRAVLQVSARPAGAAWQPAAYLTADGQNTSTPQLAIDSHGDAVAVWRRIVNSQFVAQGATYEAPSAQEPGSPGTPIVLSPGQPVATWNPPGSNPAQSVPVGATTPPPPGPPAAAIAAVRSLRVSRGAFRPPRSGPSIAAATAPKSTGTRVSYVLNTAASVRFTVVRIAAGRTVSRHCVKSTAHNRKGKPCLLLTAVHGQFTRSRPAGSDSFTFRGRLSGRALATGQYRLVATPTTGGRAGVPSAATFRVVR
jgi:hypothetical protein